MENGNPWRLVGIVSAGIISGGIFSLAALKYFGKKEVETVLRKWIRVGEVTRLIVYPIKSCQGIELSQVTATPIGLKGSSEAMRDRIFLVVDHRYSFQTQRALPRMSLIKVTVQDESNEVTVLAPGMAPLTIPTPENVRENKRSCRLWFDDIREVLDCGDEIGKWLDTFLEGSGYRLVYHFLDKTQRTQNSIEAKFPHFLPNHKGAFQDQTTFMLLAEESIAHINTKLTNEVTYKNFRPSILIRGTTEPLAEDLWSYVRVGSPDGPIFKTSKPCTRCKLTTVNPSTGEFDPDGEPLRTLEEDMARSVGNPVVDELVVKRGLFGIMMGLYREGQSIQVGDPVYAALL